MCTDMRVGSMTARSAVHCYVHARMRACAHSHVPVFYILYRVSCILYSVSCIRYSGTQVRRYAGMQVFRYAGMQVCIYAFIRARTTPASSHACTPTACASAQAHKHIRAYMAPHMEPYMQPYMQAYNHSVHACIRAYNHSKQACMDASIHTHLRLERRHTHGFMHSWMRGLRGAMRMRPHTLS
jgi:hypothetical protein